MSNNNNNKQLKRNVYQVTSGEMVFDKGLASSNEMHRQPPNLTATDVINDIVGDFGIWQLRTILIVFLCKIPASWFMACIIFTAPELYAGKDFYCVQKNSSQRLHVSADQCIVTDSSSSTSARCPQFNYANSDFHSLIMDFDLVCWRDILIAWTQYWHLFGVLLGGIFATKLMIEFSPRYVYALGMLTQIICGVATGYAWDFSLHCALRCMSAICCALMFTAGQAIFCDITSGIYRVGALLLYDTFWSIGVIFLPGLVWFFNNWTDIYLGITFPTLALFILLLWTPDSPRWLLKHAKATKDVEAVECMLRQAAQINERQDKIPNNLQSQLQELSEKLKSQSPPPSWLDLWSGHRAKINMVATHAALAVFIINYMGMLLNIRSFGRDYLVPNTIAMGFAEILGCFLALHFVLKYNRWKWQLAGALNILAGLVGCTGWFFTQSNSIDDNLKVVLWMIIALIPKMGVSCAQSMLLACMSELMPLGKRVTFAFSVVTWARIWLLSAPFINVLKRFDVALSLSAYSCLSIIGGIFTCLLLTPWPVTPAMETPPRYINKHPNALEKAVWTVQDDVLNTRL